MNAHANLAKKFVATILIAASTSIFSQAANAYDGDVDYNAPYLTVDPETGKLVTIDPKTQTTTPHQQSADTAATTTGAPEDSQAQAGSLMSQTSATNPSNTSGVQSESAARSTMPVIIGVIITLIIISFVFFSNRKKPAVDTTPDTDDS